MSSQLNEPLAYEQVVALLEGLSLDIRLSWNHAAHRLWRMLDPQLWEQSRNPLVLLQTTSREHLMEVIRTESFQECFRDLLLQAPIHGAQRPGSDPMGTIAYFSMEYMLTESLPIYSGGLGNVAGDQLKAASDLDLPVVAVGLLYQQGYIRQEIDYDGRQIALFPYNNPRELPISPVRRSDGEWVRIKMERPDFTLWLRAWQANLGAAKLYLLDTNDPANPPAVRLLGSELYGGGLQMRLRQELVLGVGGWRLLRELGLNPAVCHLNEGHAAFAVLERARGFMEDTSCDFTTALTATRAGNLFTTHTPVDAGFDRFSPELMDVHLRHYAEELLHIDLHELLALGRLNPDDNSEPFNMAYLAMRGSGFVNGVSRMHGKVSRRIFLPFFHRWPEAEVPVGHVTNGVHPETWASAEASALWHKAATQGKRKNDPFAASVRADAIQSVSDRELWKLRNKQRSKFLAYAHKHLLTQRAAVGQTGSDSEHPLRKLDPHALTLVFARRFAEYKRPTLLLHDPARLAGILRDQDRPMQLIVAGKAHPADEYGQSMIKTWNDFIDGYGLQDKVVFLADYDMSLTQKMVQGADVWINTPRPPWEASGTSGMKVLVNGGLNLSVLDGWWSEAYKPEFGWAVRSVNESDRDARDAAQIYSLLEDEIKPLFYDRDANGTPTAWIAKVRASMVHLTPRFSARRAVLGYLEHYYMPAAESFVRRSENDARLARDIVAWKTKIIQSWNDVSIVKRETLLQKDAAPHYLITATIRLGRLCPEDVTVEVYAENNGAGAVRITLTLQGPAPDDVNLFVYTGEIPCDRPETDYTVRVLPHHPEVRIPLELNEITWER